MAKPKLLILLIPTFLVLSSCASSSKYTNSKDGDTEYVYVIDYEKVAKIKAANKKAPWKINTLWVNYPKKKVKKSELNKQ